MRMRGERACLDESKPIPRVEYAFPHELLALLIERRIHPCSLRILGINAIPFFSCVVFSRNVSVASMLPGRVQSDQKLTTKFSFI